MGTLDAALIAAARGVVEPRQAPPLPLTETPPAPPNTPLTSPLAHRAAPQAQTPATTTQILALALRTWDNEETNDAGDADSTLGGEHDVEVTHSTLGEEYNADNVDPISANEHDAGYADSAVGEEYDDDIVSLTSTVFQTETRFGRQYKNSTYLYPNDEDEQARLDIAHEAYTNALGNKLFCAPIDPGNNFKVLDIGTGTGIWAIDFADKYPKAWVVGWDISAIQPNSVPPNLEFIVDDAEDWVCKAKFDFIRVRDMAGSFKDWPRLVRQIYDKLKPGGWVEFLETDNEIRGRDGKITFDNPLAKQAKHRRDAHEKVGRPLNIAALLRGWSREAGFVHVNEEKVPLPVGMWAKDSVHKNTGRLWALNLLEGVHALTARPLEVLGRSQAEALVFEMEVRRELERASRGEVCYWSRLFVVTAQKPGA